MKKAYECDCVYDLGKCERICGPVLQCKKCGGLVVEADTEQAVMKRMDEMCIPSLPPDLMQNWDEIKEALCLVRRALKEPENNCHDGEKTDASCVGCPDGPLCE